MTIYNLYVSALVRILALVYSIKVEEIFLEMGLFVVSRFLNAVERVER